MTSVRRAAGFTLIELLAATALSAALLTVGFGILRGLGRPIAAEASSSSDWLAPLARQLRWDAGHAVAFGPDAGGVSLAGLLAVDPLTLEPLHRPAIVTLRVERLADVGWLVRDESTLGERSGRTTTSQLLVAGVRAIHLENLDVAPPTVRGHRAPSNSTMSLARDASLPPVFRNLPGWSRTPDHFRIVVEFDDATRQPLTIWEVAS